MANPEDVQSPALGTILIVDDEPLPLNVYTNALVRKGYQVLPANGPHQALDIVRRQPPVDAVLTDYQMPGMLGTDLIREIVELSPETACVLVTGGVIDRSDIPPCVHVLRKPCPIPDLIAAVQGAVARSIELRARLRESMERSAELLEDAKRLVFEYQEAARHAADTVAKSRLNRAHWDCNTGLGLPEHPTVRNALLLIVDADPSFLEMAQQQLASGFRDVLFAGDGNHAMELLRTVGMEVSAALINLRLPGPPNGVSLIRKLHADYPQMPLIAISTQADGNEVERAKAVGAVEVLQKPISEEWRGAIARVRRKH